MRSAHSRTYLSSILIFLIALLILGWILQLFTGNYLAKTAFSRLQQQAQVLSDLSAAYYDQGGLSSIQYLFNLEIASQAAAADAVVCDAKGNILTCSRDPLGCTHRNLTINGELFDRAMRMGHSTDTGVLPGLYEENRYVCAQVIYSGEQAVGLVLVSTPTAQTMQVLDRISDSFLVASLITVLISMFVMNYISKFLGSPLREMAKTASAFGHGDLDARVRLSPHQPEEVEELALAFNNMATSLQKSEYQRQEFVANVSHELKTPMTTIGGYIDGMLDGTIPPEKHRHYMQIVSDETKRLSRLVRSMLDIAQLQSEGGIPEEKKTRFDISECAGQMLLTFEQKILAKELEVDAQLPDYPLYTVADRDSICQVIYNLIDNAVKFCPEGETIGLKLRTGDSKIYLSVSNRGQTIPARELPLVFDRFHKMDKSRSQNREGWGLGLYIVKTIVCSHGEDISVTSVDGLTTFTFTLPLVN
jgi:signal transduction histidine kinase